MDGFLLETFAASGSDRNLIGDEDGSRDLINFFGSASSAEYPPFWATSNEPEGSSDIFGLTSTVTDSIDTTGRIDTGFGIADHMEGSLDISDQLLTPSDPKPEDLLAFHDGDLPDEGWGECDFPKTPACCEHTESGVICIWYKWMGPMCPDHPDDIWPPRTEEDKARNRAVCCDQIVDKVGIGCVPVRGRIEENEVESAFPDLKEFNDWQFQPIPGACESVHRRDEQISTQCLPQKQ